MDLAGVFNGPRHDFAVAMHPHSILEQVRHDERVLLHQALHWDVACGPAAGRLHPSADLREGRSAARARRSWRRGGHRSAKHTTVQASHADKPVAAAWRAPFSSRPAPRAAPAGRSVASPSLPRLEDVARTGCGKYRILKLFDIVFHNCTKAPTKINPERFQIGGNLDRRPRPLAPHRIGLSAGEPAAGEPGSRCTLLGVPHRRRRGGRGPAVSGDGLGLACAGHEPGAGADRQRVAHGAGRSAAGTADGRRCRADARVVRICVARSRWVSARAGASQARAAAAVREIAQPTPPPPGEASPALSSPRHPVSPRVLNRSSSPAPLAAQDEDSSDDFGEELMIVTDGADCEVVGDHPR